MSDDVIPFRVDVPEASLADLRERLRRTRWPEPETVTDWSQGTPLPYVRELCQYWLMEYEWPAAQARLNAFPQFVTRIDGLDLPFLHVRPPPRTRPPWSPGRGRAWGSAQSRPGRGGASSGSPTRGTSSWAGSGTRATAPRAATGDRWGRPRSAGAIRGRGS